MEKHRSHQLKPGTILDGRYETGYGLVSVITDVFLPGGKGESDEKATAAQYEKIMEELDRRGLVDSESVASKMSPHLVQ